MRAERQPNDEKRSFVFGERMAIGVQDVQAIVLVIIALPALSSGRAVVLGTIISPTHKATEQAIILQIVASPAAHAAECGLDHHCVISLRYLSGEILLLIAGRIQRDQTNKREKIPNRNLSLLNRRRAWLNGRGLNAGPRFDAGRNLTWYKFWKLYEYTPKLLSKEMFHLMYSGFALGHFSPLDCPLQPRNHPALC